jgi:hypothetical protein
LTSVLRHREPRSSLQADWVIYDRYRRRNERGLLVIARIIEKLIQTTPDEHVEAALRLWGGRAPKLAVVGCLKAVQLGRRSVRSSDLTVESEPAAAGPEQPRSGCLSEAESNVAPRLGEGPIPDPGGTV